MEHRKDLEKAITSLEQTDKDMAREHSNGNDLKTLHKIEEKFANPKPVIGKFY